MRILDLCPDDKKAIQQVALLLIAGFKSHWSNAWPDMEAAVKGAQETPDAPEGEHVGMDTSGLEAYPPALGRARFDPSTR